MAEINIRNSNIHVIEKEAFASKVISLILMTNSEIHLIHSDAFHDSTLVSELKINNCSINEIEPNAIVAGITTLTVQRSRYVFVLLIVSK